MKTSIIEQSQNQPWMTDLKKLQEATGRVLQRRLKYVYQYCYDVSWDWSAAWQTKEKATDTSDFGARKIIMFHNTWLFKHGPCCMVNTKICWILKANLQSEIKLLDQRNEALEKILQYKHSAAEIAVQAADIRSIEDDMNVWFCWK